MWQIYAEQLVTGDIDGTDKTKALKVKFHRNFVLRAIRTWFVYYNDPVFDELYLRIYADADGAAGKLLHTSSNFFTPVQIATTESYAVKGIYFEFSNDPAFNEDQFYWILPYATNYTGTTSSHLAWKKGWPDNEYRLGLDLDYNEILRSPYNLAVVGSDL